MKRQNFYKRISILLTVSFLLIFPLVVLAEDVNLCLNGMPTFNKISLQQGNSGTGWHGVAANINDDNTGTYIGANGRYIRGNVHAIYEAIVEFAAEAPEISSVSYNRYESVSGLVGSKGGYLRTYLWYSNQWNQIYEETIPQGASGISGERTITGTWYNVSKVKVYTYIYGNGGSTRTGRIDSKLYELRAFGQAAPAFIDIGLRVWDQSLAGPIKIAAWPLGEEASSSLRIAADIDNNGTPEEYGIALVDPGDAMDSGVRIQIQGATGSEIKALRKLE